MKARLGDLCVGLAANCDVPEAGIEDLMRSNLKDARVLPFVAYITHDRKWVDGYAGNKAGSVFIGILEKAENTPYLKATEAVRKKLAGYLKQANKSAEKGKWNNVVRAQLESAKLSGRCPERKEINQLYAKARAWADSEFKRAIELAKTSGDTSAAHKILADVKKPFRGDPIVDEAVNGQKALRKLKQILRIESSGTPPDGLREKAAEPYKDTRWAALFVN